MSAVDNLGIKLPPHSIEAEHSVLGGLLVPAGTLQGCWHAAGLRVQLPDQR